MLMMQVCAKRLYLMSAVRSCLLVLSYLVDQMLLILQDLFYYKTNVTYSYPMHCSPNTNEDCYFSNKLKLW